MAAALMNLLRKTLDELTGAEFKRFKYCLRDEGQIAWGTLEKADTDDTVEKMVKVYSMGAGDVVIKVLKNLDHNHLVMDLEPELKKLGCGQSGEDNRKSTAQSEGHIPLQKLLSKHKDKMKGRAEYIHEGMEKTETQASIKKIFTELYITEGKMEEVNSEHEVWQMEAITKAQITEDHAICCNDIFKPLPGQREIINAVLTMGIAGIGKTVLVKKFILDWCEGEANQDVGLMIMLPFREMNLVTGEKSLHELFCIFCPELKKLKDMSVYDETTMFVIFDGLDESKIELDFNKSIISSVNEVTMVDVLVVNIIRRNLLPSSHVWITSRPAAIDQIPSKFIDRITEIHGFNDVQKEEYFYKNSEPYANQIVSHVKSSRILHIMCHIPIFCWILATVLGKMLKGKKEEMPKTITEMYIHFLLIQIYAKNLKYHGGHGESKQNLWHCHRDGLLKLAKLASQHLYNSSILFYKEDLDACGIDVCDGSVYSGMFTGIFKKDGIFFEEKIYCFVHLSIQEFLAALHVFSTKVVADADMALDELLRSEVNKALDSKNGHLDLFVRFLHGISLKSNQKLLRGLLPGTHSSSESVEKTSKNLKELLTQKVSPERCINLLHCLAEMHDYSLHDEIQAFLKENDISKRYVSPGYCSTLAYMSLESNNVMDEFDQKKYNTSLEGHMRLVPIVRCCRKAVLSGCQLTENCCETVASALKSANSPLRELDLSYNDLQKLGTTLLSALQSPHCKLEALRIAGCNLTEESCEAVASALQSANPTLRELDLSRNNLQESGEKLLCALQRPHCNLERIRLADCKLTEKSCKIVTSALQSANSTLRELDLSHNVLKRSQEVLVSALQNPHCQLEILRLAGCKLTEESSAAVASALNSSVCLIELDLGGNQLSVHGVQLLYTALSHPNCKLQNLRLAGCKLTEEQCESVAKAVPYMKSLTVLDLSENHMSTTGLKHLNAALWHPSCQLKTLRLADCKLTEQPCEVIASDVHSWRSLTELDLSDNYMSLSGIQRLNAALPHLKLQILRYHHGENGRIKPELNACELTLDPNTVNYELTLSEENRKLTWVSQKQQYPDHPDRFDYRPQVLCREGLSERHYWEAEWGAPTSVAVAYKSINRKGGGLSTWFGMNDKSWRLNCHEGRYMAYHNAEMIDIPAPSPRSTRVGVYLDWPAGTLSFYSVSSDTLTHLHTSHSKFNEPLYPGFRVYDTSVSLCQITDHLQEHQSL